MPKVVECVCITMAHVKYLHSLQLREVDLNQLIMSFRSEGPLSESYLDAFMVPSATFVMVFVCFPTFKLQEQQRTSNMYQMFSSEWFLDVPCLGYSILYMFEAISLPAGDNLGWSGLWWGHHFSGSATAQPAQPSAKDSSHRCRLRSWSTFKSNDFGHDPAMFKDGVVGFSWIL